MASKKKNHAIVGVFETKAGAEQAIADLKADGFKDSQIGLVYRDVEGKTVRKGAADDTNAPEGAAIGAAIGGAGGALVGAGILAGAIVPVVGPIFALGTLSTVLLNAAGGAAIAGIAGALIGWGISDEDARYYENAVSEGQYLVTIESSDRDAEARAILHRFSGFDRYGWLAVQADRQNRISAGAESSGGTVKRTRRARQTV